MSSESEATVNALKAALTEANGREAVAKAELAEVVQREASLVQELRDAQLAANCGAGGTGVRETKTEEEATDLRTVLHDFYSTHNPEKLRNLDTILKHYAGKELSLIRTIEEKYSVKLKYRPPPLCPKVVKVPVAVAGTGVRHWLVIAVLLIVCASLLYQALYQFVVNTHHEACVAAGSIGSTTGSADAAGGACPVGVSNEVAACFGRAPAALEMGDALVITMTHTRWAWQNKEAIAERALEYATRILDNPEELGRSAVEYAHWFTEGVAEALRLAAGSLGLQGAI